MNGGIAVDVWGRSSLEGAYAAGEAAGTHGVTRPGGAALISGQVFGLRCAEHLAATRAGAKIEPDPALVEKAVAQIVSGLRKTSALSPAAIAGQVQARMSDAAGFIATPGGVRNALAQARAPHARVAAEGI